MRFRKSKCRMLCSMVYSQKCWNILLLIVNYLYWNYSFSINSILILNLPLASLATPNLNTICHSCLITCLETIGSWPGIEPDVLNDILECLWMSWFLQPSFFWLLWKSWDYNYYYSIWSTCGFRFFTISLHTTISWYIVQFDDTALVVLHNRSIILIVSCGEVQSTSILHSQHFGIFMLWVQIPDIVVKVGAVPRSDVI